MTLNIERNVPLAPYTTFNIGGFAKYFVVTKTEEQVLEACKWAKENSLTTFVLGEGSNILISDAGFDGLVLFVDIKGGKYSENAARTEVTADIKAGEIWDFFVKESVIKGYVGVECLSGIPGRVGGTLVQNIGAYGQEIGESVEKVRFYDTEKQKFDVYSNKECHFKYRESIFKGDSSKIVVSVMFKLKLGEKPGIKHKELAARFSGMQPGVEAVRNAVLELRKSKSMLVDPADPNTISAGSFFKNPIITADVYTKIHENYPDIPTWMQVDGTVKLSAGWLIEQSGLARGFVYKTGKVGLSQKHALAIINRGGAYAEDVVEFSRFIQDKVYASFGVKLEPEVVFVGFD